MKAEEYDDYLLDPTGFFLSKYLPRVGEAFEGLAELPMFPALYYIRLMLGIAPVRKSERRATRSPRCRRPARRRSG